jgi:hypothetical protein
MDERTYRIFISYSHEDRRLAERVVRILEENGLQPMWDEHLQWGGRFSDQIRNLIAFSHAFIPLITESSSKRGWVHQEIGYAMALNVPVLPICLGRLPGEMLSELQATVLDELGKDTEVLRTLLSKRTFESLIRRAQEEHRPLYECADYQEDRTRMMVIYASKILEFGHYGHVYQKGALSSFHIPDRSLSHSVWQARWGSTEVTEYRKRLLRSEREVLEKHARKKGCTLMIDPSLDFEKYGKKARKVRLETLLGFLTSMPRDKIRIAIREGMPKSESLTIVGDWFAAESVSASIGKGYRQTIFTRYAPTVQSKIDEFEEEVNEVIIKDPSTGNSVDYVKNRLEKILKEI